MGASFDIQPFLGSGAFGAIVGGLTGYLAYRQAIKVAAQQAAATVDVKRLENDSHLHGFLHEDLKLVREELKEARQALFECVGDRAKADSEVVRLTETNIDLRMEIASLELSLKEVKDELDAAEFEVRQLKTRLIEVEWIEKGVSLDALKEIVRRREAEQNAKKQQEDAGS